jgi:hypothetical protein
LLNGPANANYKSKEKENSREVDRNGKALKRKATQSGERHGKGGTLIRSAFTDLKRKRIVWMWMEVAISQALKGNLRKVGKGTEKGKQL